MASGTLDADKISKEKSKWGGGNKVYTRRPKKGIKNAAATATVSVTAVSSATTIPSSPVTTATAVSPITTANNEQTLTPDDANLRRQQTLRRVAEASDDSSGQDLRQVVAEEAIVPTGNGVVRPVVTFVDDRVKIHLEASTSKNDIKELREKLTAELDQVRSLVQRLEDKEAELTNNSTLLGAAGIDEAYSHSQYPGNVMIDRRALLRVNSEMGADYMDRRALARVHSEMRSDTIDRRALMRVNSEVGSLANQDTRFRQLNVSVVDNNSLGAGEFVEKEKRTPKANQYYRNSDFLLGKDRLPPESNKRLKSNGGRKYSRESDYMIGLERQKNQVFRSCSNLLQRLMKHKHGWVFNEPVNAKQLGLHDYHDIIKHPMDLGTIKSRLAQNFYKNPSEFAEDVRLTFHNAMTYNPKGQDVHVMAEQLSNIFEERWTVIESEYNRDWRYGTIHGAGTPTPTSRKVHHFAHAPIRTLDRSEPMTLPYVSRPKPSNFAPSSRTPVQTKPKAKDPNKRNMTYEEKQKLSANLQSLPSEKLDNIVQIIKKSNTSLSQHDDEIEVDIDSVDVETLWELDRFVTNYKKSLSKHRRKAELAQQARALAGNANRTMLENPATSIPEAPTEKRAAEKSLAAIPANQGDIRGDNVSRSSSSSSSSSDSGSSSSDSDSDSSSADGSDAGHSPRC
ncbi:transcription factor GTE4-like [Cynara cardunculus var. scolymus]|uniref:transcription factor GTE4-like n=1 Tax=Cynara cardunculus var. scolymus TaxID=59895 RepID=UPI000D62E9B4|nr:transcription factor GTE4-like [Cynara cardunculus var. scolymus]